MHFTSVDDGDLDANEHLISLQGHDLRDLRSAIIHIRGASHGTSEVNETRRWRFLLDLNPADFGGVQVLYDGRGPDWVGWDDSGFQTDQPTITGSWLRFVFVTDLVTSSDENGLRVLGKSWQTTDGIGVPA